jgi:hypothetical protein
MVRPRLTKPDPDRRHSHPREAGARETLRRHIAVVKALLIMLVVGTLLWGLSFVLAFAVFKFVMGYTMQDKAFLGFALILITYYPARLGVLAVLPVRY